MPFFVSNKVFKGTVLKEIIGLLAESELDLITWVIIVQINLYFIFPMDQYKYVFILEK